MFGTLEPYASNAYYCVIIYCIIYVLNDFTTAICRRFRSTKKKVGAKVEAANPVQSKQKTTIKVNQKTKEAMLKITKVEKPGETMTLRKNENERDRPPKQYAPCNDSVPVNLNAEEQSNTTRLSRRQRKNRRTPAPKSPPAEPELKKNKQTDILVNVVKPLKKLKLHVKLKDFAYIPVPVIWSSMVKYVLAKQDLVRYGFPTMTNRSGVVTIYRDLETFTGVTNLLYTTQKKQSKQSKAIADEGTDSGIDQNDSESETRSGKSTPDPTRSATFDVNACEFYPTRKMQRKRVQDSDMDSPASTDIDDDLEVRCVRCKSMFFIAADLSKYITEECCSYHSGRWVTGRFSCCNQYSGTMGCVKAPAHVWNNVKNGTSILSGFVRTRPRVITEAPLALDCEMSYTVSGMEITRVSILDLQGTIVYDRYVLPESKVVDYNTSFSGVTAENLSYATNPELRTFAQMRREVLEIIDAERILVGHGLENDLKLLRIVHERVVDTTVMFPHFRGYPFRNSLKLLMELHFDEKIHTSDKGHSSVEDAWCAVNLLWLYICKDLINKGTLPPNHAPKPSFWNPFTSLSTNQDQRNCSYDFRRSNTTLFSPPTSLKKHSGDTTVFPSRRSFRRH